MCRTIERSFMWLVRLQRNTLEPLVGVVTLGDCPKYFCMQLFFTTMGRASNSSGPSHELQTAIGEHT